MPISQAVTTKQLFCRLKASKRHFQQNFWRHKCGKLINISYGVHTNCIHGFQQAPTEKFAQRSRLLFFLERTRLNNVVNKKKDHKIWTGIALCFSDMNAIFQSIFSQVHRFMQKFFMCKERNLAFIIHSLVVGIDCVADKEKLEWKLHFVLNLIARMLKIAF